MQNKTIIISDPGIDDAVGLFAAIAQGEESELVATYGNASTKITSANLSGLTDFIQKNLRPQFKKTISLYAGADRALNAKKPYQVNLDFIHGKNACEGQFNKFPPIKTSSNELYKKIVKQNEKVDILSLGALTELAILLRMPGLAEKIKSITFMGGALFVQGNLDTHVEANLAPDPDALDFIFQFINKSKIPLTIVPLDITENPHLELTTERITNICKNLKAKGSSNIADMLSKLVGPKSTYPNRYRQKGYVISHIPPIEKRRYSGCPIHDLTAILAKIHPELFTTVKIPIIQRYPGVLATPAPWMNPPKYEYTVVMDIKDPEKYWDLTAEYLSKYN